jgi:hypothetical protein
MRDLADLLIDFLDRAWDDSNKEQFQRIWGILTEMDRAKNRHIYERKTP